MNRPKFVGARVSLWSRDDISNVIEKPRRRKNEPALTLLFCVSLLVVMGVGKRKKWENRRHKIGNPDDKPSKRQQPYKHPWFGYLVKNMQDITILCLFFCKTQPYTFIFIESYCVPEFIPFCEPAPEPETVDDIDSDSVPDTVGTNQTQSRTCGVSALNTMTPRLGGILHRIIGGTMAGRGQFPWQCFLSKYRGRGMYCGCSLISTNPIRVLTAAHCFKDHPVGTPVDVTFGVLDKYLLYTGMTLTSTNIIIHENYDSYTVEHDIAIIELKETIPLSSNIHPICLPSTPHENGPVFVSGWGNTEKGDDSNWLLYAELTLVPRQTCEQQYDDEEITLDMICASAPGKDSCQGDSGGPLVQKNGDHFEQIGVVSWGYGCGDPDYPGVYASVFYHLDWIKEKANLQ